VVPGAFIAGSSAHAAETAFLPAIRSETALSQRAGRLICGVHQRAESLRFESVEIVFAVTPSLDKGG
jgi:hypothetical protein